MRAKDIPEISVLVLGADGVIDSEKHLFKTPIESILDAAGKTYFSVQLNDNPSSLQAISDSVFARRIPIIVSGGFADLTANTDWVNLTGEFLEEAIAAKCPIFGICFGAQMVFRQFYPDSLVFQCVGEVGERHLDFIPEAKQTPLASVAGQGTYCFHFDGISWKDEYSEKITCLAKNQVEGITVCQAFKVKKLPIYGVQFHPEFGYQAFCTLISTYADSLKSEHGICAADVISGLRVHEAYADTLISFVEVAKEESHA